MQKVKIHGEDRGIRVKASNAERVIYDCWFQDDLANQANEKADKPSGENFCMTFAGFKDRYPSIKM